MHKGIIKEFLRDFGKPIKSKKLQVNMKKTKAEIMAPWHDSFLFEDMNVLNILQKYKGRWPEDDRCLKHS